MISNKFIEDRMKRIASMVAATTRKIIKKELRKAKRDLKKELLNKLKKNG